MARREQKPIELDLQHRKTEAGWQEVIDGFALEATSKWFDWLGWVLVLAAFQYVADQSGSLFARAIPVLSVGLLWLYFNAFFFRLHFKGWPFVRSTRVERILSMIVSGLLSSACWFAARAVANIVAANTK